MGYKSIEVYVFNNVELGAKLSKVSNVRVVEQYSSMPFVFRLAVRQVSGHSNSVMITCRQEVSEIMRGYMPEANIAIEPFPKDMANITIMHSAKGRKKDNDEFACAQVVLLVDKLSKYGLQFCI